MHLRTYLGTMGFIRFSAQAIRTLTLTFVGLIVLYALAGFFLVPVIAKSQIQKNVEERLGVKPEIKKIKFHPFTFEAAIEGFSLPEQKGDKPRLQFDVFYVNLSPWYLLRKEIHLSEIRLKQADAQFTIFKNGETNWEMKEQAPEPESKDGGSDWLLVIEHIQIANSKVNFLDDTHNTPLTLPLGPVSLSASDISTHLGSQTSINSLAIAVGENGHAKVSGSVTPKPFAANLELDLAKIPLEFLTAYLSDKTFLVLNQGSVDVTGKLKYQKGEILFNGDSKINDLVINQEDVESPVVTWKSLDLKKIELQTSPMSLRIDEAILDHVDTEVVVRKDGTLNYRQFMRNPAPLPKANGESKVSGSKAVAAKNAKAESAEQKSAFDYHVGKLTLIDGEIDYADEQIRPNFRAHIHGVDGTVAPLSPDSQQKMNIALNGAVEEYGKFEGKGYFIPGTKYPSLNLDVNFHNIEMTTFTPYAGRFAGYEIKKGKLFLDLNYVLVNHRIKGKNEVLLDQFELGNEVESEKAPHWPLKLALALMKDRKGQIKFKLPVEGDVDSPSFSIGNLVWTALKNMFINIVAAPFDFLSSLVGGGDDMQMVFFEPGTSVPTAQEKTKIANLAKALADRPNLSVEIKGQYQAADIAALQKSEFEEKLQIELKKANGNHDRAVMNVAKVTVKSDELSKFTTDFKAEHNGSDKDLSAELEKKVISSIPVSEDELKALCLARGNAVMSALVAQKIPAVRLFILAGDKSGDDQKAPHTLLTLK